MTNKYISALARRTLMIEPDVISIIRSAPRRYKEFFIAKRSGNLRLIAQPAREVKDLQRAMVVESSDLFAAHPSCTAYERGTGIVQNAEAHKSARFFLKLDFANFFNSITAANWGSFCATRNVDSDYVQITSSLFFWTPKRTKDLVLSVGAPSSPFVSNRIMFDFDKGISDRLKKMGCTYTRYADDLTISYGDAALLGDVKTAVSEVLSTVPYLNLSLNEKKTFLAGRGIRRSITGITVTPSGELSIGRERKRSISAMAHHLELGKLSKDEGKQLGGLLAFAYSVEPAFALRMCAKYPKVLEVFGATGGDGDRQRPIRTSRKIRT